jgi:hypothetical protein
MRVSLEFFLNAKDFDPAGFMTAIAFGIKALEALNGGCSAAISWSVVSRPSWLGLTWASRALPLSQAASKVFFTMYGASSEQHTAQANRTNIYWATGVSLLLTSVSVYPSRIAASEGKALSAWATFCSLK